MSSTPIKSPASKSTIATSFQSKSLRLITKKFSFKSLFKRKSDRIFQRIELNARLRLTDNDSNQWLCNCINFSEDGVDVSDVISIIESQDKPLKIGSRLSLQIVDIEDAPTLQAVVMKSGPKQLGLKFLKEA